MTEEDLKDAVSELERDLMFFKDKYDQIQEQMEEVEKHKSELEKHVDVQASNIDFNALADFVNEKYWIVNEKDDNSYEIFIPSFMDVQAGVLKRQMGGYNVFVLDQTTKMISGIPEFLQDEVDLDDRQSFKVKGDLLEFDEDKKSEVENELDEHIEDVKDDRATIKDDHGHSLVLDLLERGEMPFSPSPVSEDDLRDSETTHELRDYQEEAFQEWLEHGAITLCFMTGAGKTHVGIEALDVLNYDQEKGRKAVVAGKRKMIGTQWKNRMEKYAPRLKPVIMSGRSIDDIPEEDDVVEIYTYNSLHKLEEMINRGHEYNIIQFDEGDYIGAEKFSRGSTYPMKYRIGHTASPIRSVNDPRKVFALTGKPVGMNWQKTLEHLDQEMFPINIHVVKDDAEKIERVKETLDPEKTTVIVVEHVQEGSIGQKLSEELDLEFVHGQSDHDDQKKAIDNALEEDNAVVASRIVRRGVTIENIEQLIEVDRRGDSRRDTIQVVGRLFHGRADSAELIYTIGEANSFEETFLGILEKGFEINDIDDALELQDLGDRLDSMADIDIDSDSSEVDVSRPELDKPRETVEPVITGDELEIVKSEKFKKRVKQASKDQRPAQKNFKNAVLALADSDEPLDRDELSIVTGYSDISYVLTPLKEDNIIEETENGIRLDQDTLETVERRMEKENKMQSQKQRVEQLSEDW